jgi:ribosomal protein S18 acetylase RimI-like enzyme
MELMLIDTLFRVTEKHIDPTLDLVVAAFFDDPMSVRFLPQPKGRAGALRMLFKSAIRHALKTGEVWASSPNFEAVAVWYAPGHTDMPISSYFTLDTFRLLPAFLAAGVRNFMESYRYQSMIQDLHKQDVPQPHWYLSTLGTHPKYQGQGFGSKLLRPMLRRADREGLPCYLETQNEPNVAFYQKRGFEVLREVEQPNTDFKMWTMLRPPV